MGTINKKQDASIIYCSRFGLEGHSNQDIATVPTNDIPDSDLLCGGSRAKTILLQQRYNDQEALKGKRRALVANLQNT